MAIVRKRGWGLGDANCPSLAQLMGVTDVSDPCQQLSPQLVGSGPLAPGQTYAPGYDSAGLPVNEATPPPAGSASASAGLTSWLKTNPAAMLGLGAALLVVVGGALIGGRRR